MTQQRDARPLIMIIDDDVATVEMLELVLNACGYLPLSGPTTYHALAFVRSKRPALVLLNVHMSNFNAIELCRSMHADPRTAQIPIICMTSDAVLVEAFFLEDAPQTMALLSKPFTLPALQHAIATRLAAP